ncbi:hypothetical protein HXZ94_07470 [Empedobacter falsenii]|uniref:hypothetical protein n=1 Tax=Empedobacter falsenii TaxID=343874 RepID=UPI00257881CD|nr:hypothetical protein [Empedobacter falsenii]MDM1298340.1 hypothetical protein [Empedobacter falsenii]MDM1318103.1 hypothetical protein [Empedobacter falsenii]
MKKIIKKLKNQDYFEDDLGLEKSKINELEDQLNSKIPDFFREYLKYFGFNENVFWSIFNEEDEFVEQNELIQELGHTNFIAIGDEYAENLIVANIENQQLYLLEDDLLIDLKNSFEQMLHEAISTFDLPDFDALQNIETAFKVLLERKTEITTALIDSLNELINEAEQNDDSLFSIIISSVPNDNYVVYGGSFNDFKNIIDAENIDYDHLWSINSAKYQQPIKLNQKPSKAMDLLLLEILKNLKNEGYFEQQIENFSISIQSGDVNFFIEDSYDEALTKKNNLETKIKRFWESSYDRTRLLIEVS